MYLITGAMMFTRASETWLLGFLFGELSWAMLSRLIHQRRGLLPIQISQECEGSDHVTAKSAKVATSHPTSVLECEVRPAMWPLAPPQLTEGSSSPGRAT